MGQDQVEAEFAAFVQQASPRLLRAAWFLCGEAHAAQDLVQGALEKVLPRWRRVRDGDPLAYTRTVMLNLHRDQTREHRRETVVADVPDPGWRDHNAQDHTYLARLLAQLPPRERQVVTLRYYVGMSEADVAAHLGISVGAVKSSASKGAAKLRAFIHREDSEHVH
ncbi:SigE family RNA polymerase sigma factor [Phycicoccus sp. M110.8]|uniref:SigE family RNA polymerase sigma factor n=1 Tax=Phycicoccus sp. M110.8 TaxID=3075433 RepID=UPI0028FD0DA2|nr:SigE family RNA polymerase sigma factor [Phycicoccus sp. M110.8]MDU0314085.1 SigE family RNA polymerase sigma factor [Phycicoccus sp. M110.8]